MLVNLIKDRGRETSDMVETAKEAAKEAAKEKRKQIE